MRDPYVMEVADRCRLDAEQLRDPLARGGFAPVGARGGAGAGLASQPSEAPPVDRTVTSAAAVETEALRAAVHQPEAMMGLLDGVLFADPLHRAAFEALRDAGGDVHVAAEVVGPDGAGLLARVAVEPTEADPVDVAALLVDRAGTLGPGRTRTGRAVLVADPLDFAPSMSWLKLRLEHLRADLRSSHRRWAVGSLAPSTGRGAGMTDVSMPSSGAGDDNGADKPMVGTSAEATRQLDSTGQAPAVANRSSR